MTLRKFIATLTFVSLTLLVGCGQSPDQQLSQAVKDGDETQARIALDNDADPDFFGEVKDCPVLSQSILNGYTGISIMLIDHGADVKVLCFGKFSPLMLAAAKGDIPTTKALLASEAPVNQSNFRNDTAIQIATIAGKAEIVLLHLKAGADSRQRTHLGETLLMLAAKQGYEVIVDILLEAGVDVFATNKHGRTAKELAKIKGHTAVEARLLAAEKAQQKQ